MGTRTTVYHYDLSGNLIAETQVNGTPIRAYVYADDSPLAQLDRVIVNQAPTDRLTYLHGDQQGTVRIGTDASQTVRWRWDGDAFGATPPNEDPDGDGKKTTINIAWTGTYRDSETQLYYNGARYFDAKTWRFLTPDPTSVAEHVQRWQANLGQPGQPPLEINSFARVTNNPLRWIDPDGLMGQSPGGGSSALGPYGFGGSGNQNKCEEEKCPWSITITWSYGLSHAPIRPSVTKVYSGKCLLTFGLGVKGTSMAVTTAAGSAIPGALSARGYTRAAAVAGRAAAVASSPPGWVVGGVLAADATLDFCECR